MPCLWKNTPKSSALNCKRMITCAGGAGGSGELPAGRAEQPDGAEAATGAHGQHCDWTDVPGEPGTQFKHTDVQSIFNPLSSYPPYTPVSGFALTVNRLLVVLTLNHCCCVQ